MDILPVVSKYGFKKNQNVITKSLDPILSNLNRSVKNVTESKLDNNLSIL